MGIELAEEAGDAPALVALPPPADDVSAALVVVTAKNAKLGELANKGRELTETYRGVVFDVRTVKGMDEAKKARMQFRDEVRYPMQALQEDGSKMLGQMQRQFNTRARELIEEVQRGENQVHEQIEAEETRKANEKREREAAEARRKTAHQEAIASIGRWVTEAVGMSAAQLADRITAVGEIIIDDGYEEYQGQAQQAKDEALRQLNGMHVAAKMDEAEREEIEETRRKQAAFSQAQREQQAALDAQAADLQRQREELDAQRAQQDRAQQERRDAVQRRIDGFTTVVEHNARASAEMLASVIATVRNTVLTADLLDDRVEEAQQARVDALEALESMHAAAVEREAALAAEREADRIRVNMNNLRVYASLHEDVDASGEPYSAQYLAERIESLEQELCLFADYGHQQTEAHNIKDAGMELLRAAHARALTREEQEAAEREANRARLERKMRAEERAERLVDALRAMVDADDMDAAMAARLVARDLLAEIETEGELA